MSLEGIKLFADALSYLQERRGQLLNLGGKTKDKQDIRLGQLLEDAKEAVKDEFLRITLENKKIAKKIDYCEWCLWDDAWRLSCCSERFLDITTICPKCGKPVKVMPYK